MANEVIPEDISVRDGANPVRDELHDEYAEDNSVPRTLQVKEMQVVTK